MVSVLSFYSTLLKLPLRTTARKLKCSFALIETEQRLPFTWYYIVSDFCLTKALARTRNLDEEVVVQKFCTDNKMELKDLQGVARSAHPSADLEASWSVICSIVTKKRENSAVYVTAPLQLSDACAWVVFERKLDRPWLSPSGTAEEHFRVR